MFTSLQLDHEIQLMVGHGQSFPFLAPLPSSPFGKTKGTKVAGVPQRHLQPRAILEKETDHDTPNLPFWSAREASLVLMLYKVPS